jgi:hypothetical protein
MLCDAASDVLFILHIKFGAVMPDFVKSILKHPFIIYFSYQNKHGGYAARLGERS